MRRRLFDVFRNNTSVHFMGHVDSAMPKKCLPLTHSPTLTDEMISECVPESVAVEMVGLLALKDVWGLIVFIVLVALPSYGEASQFSRFRAEVPAKFIMVPDKVERAILENYLAYLDGGYAKSLEKIISDLKKKALKNGKPISSQWISLFEGNSEFCLFKNPNICEYSVGNASSEKLKPRIEKGEKLAVELVLIYSAAVATDGADAEGLEEYQGIVKRKHPELVKKIESKHKAFFKKMPINWLEGA